MKKDTKESILIMFVGLLVVVIIELLGNYYIKYRDNNLPKYRFEVIDKWQDMKGRFLRGSTTSYYLKVKVVQLECAGRFVQEQDFDKVQIVEVDYSKYQNYNVGDKFTGTSPRFKYYE